KMVVVRTAGTTDWTNEAGDCVQEELINNILETIYRIKVKANVPKGMSETVLNNLNQSHTKCEIYVNNILEKTYFVGTPTPDHYGTYMLLEMPDKGRSPEPMIVYVPGFRGTLQPRFNADWRQWACSGIFKYKPENVKKITLKNFEHPDRDFVIESDGSKEFKISHHGEYAQIFDTTRVRDYILKFQKIHFNQYNYTMNEEQIDSIRNSNPYVQISVEGHDGKNVSVICYKIKAGKGDVDLEGNLLKWNQDVMWAFLDNGDLVKVQYFVFDKIIKPKQYFTREPLR
ncbi:MAG: hypothetical protein R2799_16155, partial [Crocinitomicaceae bacterium]